VANLLGVTPPDARGRISVDGVVSRLNVEAPGKFAVSDAQRMLEQARAMLA
jgi:hypothetical protein